MFKEMLGAIKYLHDRDIVHRDLKVRFSFCCPVLSSFIFCFIKPENVLMDEEGHIKIADFGLARVAAQNMMTTICGTPGDCVESSIHEFLFFILIFIISLF